MRIMVHDYAGHPFTAELSRGLALQGHQVDHVFFAADEGPKGRNAVEKGDPEKLVFHGLDIEKEYSKSNFLKRRAGDIAYGRRVEALIQELSPDVVISGNTPTETQKFLVRGCRKSRAKFVYWCQDFYSIAATRILSEKLKWPGEMIGRWYQYLEREQMRFAAHVVHITDGFLEQTDAWGIAREKVGVIPNWGTLADVPMQSRDNDWAKQQNLPQGTRFIYSGTLALKHNPKLLIAVADEACDDEKVIVVATGVGTEQIADAANPRLQLLPLQRIEEFSQVVGSADVLLAVIEADAGVYSVPSKVLSYLCAGRPIVLAAPRKNLAAQIVENTGAGLVVEPEDVSGFVAAARHFATNPEACLKAGAAGRAYAEEHFDMSKVTARFIDVFNKVSL